MIVEAMRHVFLDPVIDVAGPAFTRFSVALDACLLGPDRVDQSNVQNEVVQNLAMP
jgi:hypothetical protein